MTQATPPGWYPDPGQKSDGPATERWWDGEAWTDRVRPAGQGAAWVPPGQPPAGGAAYPAYPAYPTPPARRRGVRAGIAVAVAVAVLAGLGTGVYVLTRPGEDRASATQDGRGPGREDPFGGPGGGGGSPDAPDSAPPTVDSGSVTDRVSGISLPVPDGWHGESMAVGAQVTADDSYDCPGDTSKTCVKGGAYSAPALVLGTRGETAEEIAKADIEENAEESYGSAYGGIGSHEELASEAVTVAGQKGWRVRWKAVTGKGSDGYVESLAFPSPSAPQRIVVVRVGVDVDQGQAVFDDIAKGIRAASGGGDGQDI
ncbi:DUF2510 domain-containing protein [Streptomyces tagetis]|uniref:DUF2510 domain-containing protein n=1 Tax=Streptomyces tagetis TaxID=2820809 RepID=A0A940XFN0_9ACTN|nr:DUF2510 domain-containing protein [Streptomyces sp. RG38]MBQ0825756.1 DUF2510 domain-containing protein [Streptomyces sp. RG38]